MTATNPSGAPRGGVVTRFAPSPTGHLHIGGARTALFCWAFARRHGGRFILRIEDTDQARSSDESARGIMEDLAWLGIEWDEGPEFSLDGRTVGGDARGVGPFFQARRLELYNRHLRRLVEEGKAYPAFEAPEVLEAQRRAAVAAKQTYRYDRASFNAVRDVGERLRRMDSGEPHVVRLLAPAGEIAVRDEVLGEVRVPAGELDDFVIRKADGLPTYHFAVVVDDEAMGVTHVLRAQEHLANTPRHVALQGALGFATPSYAHMPLIFNMDGTKMSKRDKAKAARKGTKDWLGKDPARSLEQLARACGLEVGAVEAFAASESDSLAVAQAIGDHLGVSLPEIEVADFRRNGYTPAAITNFVALLGWNPGMKTLDGKDLEKFGLDFIGRSFSLDRVGKANAKFDRAKLLAFNSDALSAMDDRTFLREWDAYLAEYEPAVRGAVSALSPSQQLVLARAVKPRAKTLRDASRPVGFLLLDDDTIALDAGAVGKNLLPPNPLEVGATPGPSGFALLADLRSALSAHADWTPQALEPVVAEVAKARGVKLGAAAQALRTALTGTGISPALGDTLALLGKSRVLRRIDSARRAEPR